MSESSQQLDPETQEMIEAFVSEAIDSLDINEPIVDLLREEDNSEHINSIFRVFHTLKGLSGFFEMYVINKVTHEAETLLDVMRKQNRKQSEDSLTVIYSAFDFLRDLLQKVNEKYTDKDGEDDAQDMILIIKDAMEKVQNYASIEDSAGDSDLSPEDAFMMETSAIKEDISPEDAFMMDAEDEAPILKSSKKKNDDNDDSLESFVSNDLMDQYLTSANELLDLSENNLLILEEDPKNFELVANTFGAIHSLKGNSGFMGLSEVEQISIEMESILDSVRNKELDIDTTIVSILLSNIETIRDRISKLAEKPSKSPLFDDEMINNISLTDLEESEYSSSSDHNDEENDISSEEEDFIDAEEEDVFPDHQHTSEEIKPTEKPPTPQVVKPEPVKIVPKQSQSDGPAPKPQAKRSGPPPAMAKKDIRVETSKIDKLFDLVGELITIETMVTNSPDLQGLQLPNFLKSANMLNKITRELQEITMSVRMMPLVSMFNKMKRLVRDVSLKMDKKIIFEISGEETEMDKNVIDEIADPLVHILRNAIDHGVESPEKRLESGKPETGSISLKARYEGNEILIIVKDDGKGINRDVILKKAEERGLLTMPSEKMSDREVFLLLFEPGFSTAEKLTDISGRGVGMDVVKKNIEKLHGSVDVASKFGEGSTFTLRIPLTLAIMEAMLIRVGSARYALPLLAVNESFRVVPNMISKTMDGLEVCNLRNEVLPIVRLHELFNIEPDSRELDKGILIIIESRDHEVALFADEIVGQQQAVIKALSDYIGKVQGITGCMILGDGEIGLIIDIESLIELSETISQLV